MLQHTLSTRPTSAERVNNTGATITDEGLRTRPNSDLLIQLQTTHRSRAHSNPNFSDNILLTDNTVRRRSVSVTSETERADSVTLRDAAIIGDHNTLPAANFDTHQIQTQHNTLVTKSFGPLTFGHLTFGH